MKKPLLQLSKAVKDAAERVETEPSPTKKVKEDNNQEMTIEGSVDDE